MPKVKNTGKNWDTLAGRLAWLLQEKGERQKDFAKNCAISENYVSMLVTGKKTDMSDTLYRLISVLYGVDERWLRTGAGVPFRSAPREDGETVQELPDELKFRSAGGELSLLVTFSADGFSVKVVPPEK